MPKRDLAIYEADTSGSFVAPLTSIPEEKRIWRKVHEVQHHHLSSGNPLNILIRVFTAEFEKTLDEIPLDVWTPVPIYRFFRKSMSTAANISLIGSRVSEENPELNEDFWSYFEGFMWFFMKLPRFLNPKVWEARERLTIACVKHLQSFGDRYNEIQKEDPDWDQDLGSRVNRLRDKVLFDAGMSIEGRGAQLAGFLIGYVFSFHHFSPRLSISPLISKVRMKLISTFQKHKWECGSHHLLDHYRSDTNSRSPRLPPRRNFKNGINLKGNR